MGRRDTPGLIADSSWYGGPSIYSLNLQFARKVDGNRKNNLNAFVGTNTLSKRSPRLAMTIAAAPASFISFEPQLSLVAS